MLGKGRAPQPSCLLVQGKMLCVNLLKQQLCGAKGKGSAHAAKLHSVVNIRLVLLGGNLQRCHSAGLGFRKASGLCLSRTTSPGQTGHGAWDTQ